MLNHSLEANPTRHVGQASHTEPFRSEAHHASIKPETGSGGVERVIVRKPGDRQGLWLCVGRRKWMQADASSDEALQRSANDALFFRASKRRALLLEQSHNEVEPRPGHTILRVCGSRCRRHVCKRCGGIVGLQLGEGLKEAFKRQQIEHKCTGDVQMWTLTVDPKKYLSPEQAWEDVGEHRRIGELMRAMGVEFYAWVLEWHKSGWPHWHVIK